MTLTERGLWAVDSQAHPVRLCIPEGERDHCSSLCLLSSVCGEPDSEHTGYALPVVGLRPALV